MGRSKNKQEKKEEGLRTVDSNSLIEFIKQNSKEDVVAYVAIIYTLVDNEVYSYIKASTPDGNDQGKFLRDSAKLIKEEGAELKIPKRKEMH